MSTSAHRPSEPPYIGAIGPYQVIERLALGGMGTTYLARREGETMLRVVKLGHPDLPKEGLIDARLAREAAVGLRLRHPNVAALVDTGVTEQGRLYLVFEYVAGPRLTRVLESWYARGARPPIDVAVGLALQLLEGLHHIHDVRRRPRGPVLGERALRTAASRVDVSDGHWHGIHGIEPSRPDEHVLGVWGATSHISRAPGDSLGGLRLRRGRCELRRGRGLQLGCLLRHVEPRLLHSRMLDRGKHR